MAQFLEEYVEVLRAQARKSNRGATEVDEFTAGKRVLGQTALKCGVAVETAPSVQKELGCSSEGETQSNCRTLQRVIQDTQDLFVVGVARLRIGKFVKVDQLIKADKQATEARKPHEPGHQFELVIDCGVVHIGAHAKGCFRVGLGRELTAQPAHSIRLQLFIAFFETAVVGSDDICEVIPIDQLRQVLQFLANDILCRPACLLGLRLGRSNELLDNASESPAFGLGASCQIAHQLSIERSGLPTAGV